MMWKMVTSSGNGRRNDDLVRVLEHGDVVDVLVLDGATSLAERDHVDADAGDPAWFVARFADALAAAVRAQTPTRTRDAADVQGGIVQEAIVQEGIVQEALLAVHADWQARTAGLEVPLYAWPIAALAWIRLRPAAGGHLLQLYSLGDCKVLLGLADGRMRDLDPYDNVFEHQLQQSVASLVDEGVTDAGRRFAALMPTLRGRREQQQLATAPEVLCLAPRGPFAARCHTVEVLGGARLLAMTDGFYRLVDPYALLDDAGLLQACAADGLDAVLARLRRFEAGRDTARLSVKGADDATAVFLDVG